MATPIAKMIIDNNYGCNPRVLDATSLHLHIVDEAVGTKKLISMCVFFSARPRPYVKCHWTIFKICPSTVHYNLANTAAPAPVWAWLVQYLWENWHCHAIYRFKYFTLGAARTSRTTLGRKIVNFPQIRLNIMIPVHKDIYINC